MKPSLVLPLVAAAAALAALTGCHSSRTATVANPPSIYTFPVPGYDNLEIEILDPPDRLPVPREPQRVTLYVRNEGMQAVPVSSLRLVLSVESKGRQPAEIGGETFADFDLPPGASSVLSTAFLVAPRPEGGVALMFGNTNPKTVVVPDDRGLAYARLLVELVLRDRRGASEFEVAVYSIDLRSGRTRLIDRNPSPRAGPPVEEEYEEEEVYLERAPARSSSRPPEVSPSTFRTFRASEI